jgi:hypothetical protein
MKILKITAFDGVSLATGSIEQVAPPDDYDEIFDREVRLSDGSKVELDAVGSFEGKVVPGYTTAIFMASSTTPQATNALLDNIQAKLNKWGTLTAIAHDVATNTTYTAQATLKRVRPAGRGDNLPMRQNRKYAIWFEIHWSRTSQWVAS